MAREQVKRRSGLRAWLASGAALIALSFSALAVYKVHAFAMTAPQFTLREPLSIHGLQYASRARIERVFSVDYGRSVFAVSLAEKRRRLMAIDWVADASVSRLWPNRLVARITERKPVAFVNLPLPTGTTRLLLIDAEGVLLDPPPHAPFSFPVLSGVAGDDTEAVRRIRVQAMLRLLNELGPGARDISEVNTADLENLKAVTQAGGRAVELEMGDGNFGRRYQAFLANYKEIRKHSPNVRVFDLRLDDRMTARD